MAKDTYLELLRKKLKAEVLSDWYHNLVNK